MNYGYQPTRKDVIIVEAITWTYYEPLGTYESSEELYPGKVRALGIGVGYQRWFLEPSVAFNYWPVNTNFPTSFDEIESGSPDYFLFEPGLHFGFKL